MDAQLLDSPAELTIWSGTGGRLLAKPKRFDRLSDALTAARAHSDPSAQPWIVTEDGDMLAPSWIRSQTV